VLFDLFDSLGDKRSFDDFSGGRKGIVEGCGSGDNGCTGDLSDDLSFGDGVRENGTTSGIWVGKASVGVGKASVGNGVASITIASRNCELGTSGHENNGKDNELIHGDVELCAMALNEL